MLILLHYPVVCTLSAVKWTTDLHCSSTRTLKKVNTSQITPNTKKKLQSTYKYTKYLFLNVITFLRAWNSRIIIGAHLHRYRPAHKKHVLNELSLIYWHFREDLAQEPELKLLVRYLYFDIIIIWRNASLLRQIDLGRHSAFVSGLTSTSENGILHCPLYRLTSCIALKKKDYIYI